MYFLFRRCVPLVKFASTPYLIKVKCYVCPKTKSWVERTADPENPVSEFTPSTCCSYFKSKGQALFESVLHPEVVSEASLRSTADTAPASGRSHSPRQASPGSRGRRALGAATAQTSARMSGRDPELAKVASVRTTARLGHTPVSAIFTLTGLKGFNTHRPRESGQLHELPTASLPCREEAVTWTIQHGVEGEESWGTNATRLQERL